MSYRLKDFGDDEIIVLDIALAEDAGKWNNDEKEKIRKDLQAETTAEIEERSNLIPED